MAAIDPDSEERHVRSDSETHPHLWAMLHGRDSTFATRKKIGWRQKIEYSGCEVSNMSFWWVRNLAAQNKRRSLRATELPKNKPKRCKQDKSPNLILSVLTYWEETEESTVVDRAPSYPPDKPQRPSTSEVLFSFSGNYSPHLATQKTSPCLTMSQRNSFSKLPFPNWLCGFNPIRAEIW